MADAKELDPTLFLTTLPCWSQPALIAEITRGPGALAGLKVVPRERNVPHGASLNEALGRWVSGCWPAVVAALAAWPGAVAQRGGWPLIWAYAPDAEVEALGAALSEAVTLSAPATTPPLLGQLVVVPVAGAGAAAGDAATRAVEDELHRWADHDGPAAEYRSSIAPSAQRQSARVENRSHGGATGGPRPRGRREEP